MFMLFNFKQKDLVRNFVFYGLKLKCIYKNMSDKPANIICNGELEIIKITEDLYDDAVELFSDNYLYHENLCLATRLSSSKESFEEMQDMFRHCLKDNISFAARNIANGELAAMTINHLARPKSEPSTKHDKTEEIVPPPIKCIREFVNRIETSADIFKLWQIDCVFEIVYLYTNPKYAKRGLASKLSEYSIEYARRLQHGTLPPEDLPAEHLRGLKPSAVSSVFTSIYTQHIGRKFNFEIINKLAYTDISFEGQPFAERLDPIHKCATFEALRL